VPIRLNGLPCGPSAYRKRLGAKQQPHRSGLSAQRSGTLRALRLTWTHLRPTEPEELCGRIGRALPVRLPQAL
jgi:hypothetical protein